MEPSNDTPFLTTMDLTAMPIGLEKSEPSQGFNDTPLVPSQALIVHTEPDKSSHLDQLLDEYARLQKNLIDEIHSEQYIIQQNSRKRLKLWVDNAHNDEVRRLMVTYPYYYDANGELKESGKRQMQPSRVGGLGEKDAENIRQVDISDNFESKPTDRTSNSSSQRSEKMVMMPRPPAPEPCKREFMALIDLEDEMEEPEEAEREKAAELVDNEEANFCNSDQLWNWWSKEIPDETVELIERKEHANAGYKESVADRLLAAWTTVKPVM